MRRIPSFFALRAFEAAGRLGSFVQASEELHLTPSAISHQIRALEEHFGRSLFIRRSRQVELTTEGQHLLSRLTQSLDSIEAACAEVARAPQAEVLALHCAPSLASKWLGPRLPGFLQRHPGISLRMSASADPINLARHEDLDMVIAYGAVPAQRGICTEPLGMELVTAFATPGLMVQAETGRPGYLERMVLIESAVNPVHWPDWCAINGLTMPSAGSRPSFDRGALAISAAVQGLGAVLESTRFAQEEVAKGELVPLGGEQARSIPRVLHFLCYRDAQRDLPRVAAFRAWLLEAASSDLASGRAGS